VNEVNREKWRQQNEGGELMTCCKGRERERESCDRMNRRKTDKERKSD